MPFRLGSGDVRHFLREIGRRPLAFVVRRGKDQVLGRARRGLASLGWNPYRARLTRSDPGSPSILPPEGLVRSIDRGREEWPDRVGRLLRRADRNAERQFEALSVPVRGDPRIDWHRDPGSNGSWPVRFHTAYSYADLIDLSRPTDVKVPWELSRLRFLPRLAVAYRLTGDGAYVVAAREILEEWDRDNPVGYGINWTVGMEVALRALSVILAGELLGDTDARDEFVDDRFVELLAEHGRFLYRNIEYSDVNGNHFTSCLLGLLYLGARVGAEPESAAWRDHALERLEAEIQLQIYPDGVCHEGSIPYHGLVTELFSHALLVACRSGDDLGAAYRERLGRMLEFVRACLKPSGGVPIWGDTDDGRVFSLGGDIGVHHRSILALGAGLLGRPDLWNAADRVPLESALLLGPAGMRALEGSTGAASAPVPEPSEATAQPSPEPPPGSVAFPEGGFFLLRDRDDYCLVDCGDVGLRGRGGHGHNDVLSVEMVISGHDVLVDTGSSSYTRSVDDRVACLGVRAHNAAMVDNREPAQIVTSRIAHPTECLAERVTWDPEGRVFVGRHHGYASLPGIGYYERTVRHLDADAGFSLQEILSGEGRHRASWHFHLAPAWERGDVLADSVRLARSDIEGVVLEVRWDVPDPTVELESTPVYPVYGVRWERLCVLVATEASFPLRARFDFRLLTDVAVTRTG